MWAVWGGTCCRASILPNPWTFVDPQGGGDYYAAGTAISKAVDANGGNQFASVAPIPYF